MSGIKNVSPLLALAFGVLAIATAAYAVRAIYRVYFHPLARFPGPKAAAISRRWQKRVVSQGWPEKVYEQLHRQYHTAALRIGPNELHISDPELYKTIYSQSSPFLKDDSFYSCFMGAQNTIFTTVNQDEHREKRRLFNPLFSKQGVLKLESVILDKVKQMAHKAKQISKGGSVEISSMARCMTVDVITDFAFGRSLDILHEEPGSFQSAYLQAFDKAVLAMRTFQFSSFMKFLAPRIPRKWMAALDDSVKQRMKLAMIAKRSVEDHKHRRNLTSHPVIFDYTHTLPEEKRPGESLVILIAGSDTTGFTLTFAMYQILKNPQVEARLVRELDGELRKHAHWPSLTRLEQLEYLQAVIREALRLGAAIPGQLPRIVPSPSPLIIHERSGDAVVPPGTVVGMSAYSMNMSTSVWGPDALTFNPDRWLSSSRRPNAKGLDAYLATFSKGTRACIGMNIANAELTIALAWLFSHFRMRLRTPELTTKDMFVQLVQQPGVLVDFEER